MDSEHCDLRGFLQGLLLGLQSRGMEAQLSADAHSETYFFRGFLSLRVRVDENFIRG